MRIWIIISLLLSSICFAEERYISNQLTIPLRGGEGDQFSLIQEVSPATPVTLLESNSQTGYSKVQLNNGVEGYLQTRFLTKTPQQAGTTPSKSSNELQQQLQQAKQEAAQLKEAHSAQEQLTESLRQENAILNEQLSSLADGITDQDSLRQAEILKQTNNTLKAEIEQLKTAYSNMNKQTTYKWFITGAAITFGGVLLGLFTARITGRRRSSWSQSF